MITHVLIYRDPYNFDKIKRNVQTTLIRKESKSFFAIGDIIELVELSNGQHTKKVIEKIIPGEEYSALDDDKIVLCLKPYERNSR